MHTPYVTLKYTHYTYMYNNGILSNHLFYSSLLLLLLRPFSLSSSSSSFVILSSLSGVPGPISHVCSMSEARQASSWL